MTLEIVTTYAAALALLIGSGFVMVGVIGLLADLIDKRSQ